MTLSANDTALVLVDIQNDYFPGGRMVLSGPEAAAERAAALLARAREAGRPVIHVRHEAARPGATFFLPGTEGAAIHPAVAPLPGEAVVLKHFPNSFRGTDLQARLDGLGVKRILLAGMMTHMCIDATARAAFDLGYGVTLVADACATRDLTGPDGRVVAAADVHAAFLAALGAGYVELTDAARLAQA
ncbi:MAG: cysteine hydrolase family protein [Desulfovibrionaceae bacterium]